MTTNRILLLALLSLLCTGCQSFGSKSMPKLWPSSEEKPTKLAKSKYQQPTRMVVLWSPAMYTQAGSQAARGFGGRIYFYNAKEETIPVEGQLVVYGFNDTKNAAAAGKMQPDKTFGFRSEEFSKHFTPTQLGASYSIWVPWDAVGGPEAEISLLPIFTSASGQVCVGQQALQVLPGTKTELPQFQINQVPQPVTQISPPGTSGGAMQIPAAYPQSPVQGQTMQGANTISQVGYQEAIPNMSGMQGTVISNSMQNSGMNMPMSGNPLNMETLSISLPSATAQRLVGNQQGAEANAPASGYNYGAALGTTPPMTYTPATMQPSASTGTQGSGPLPQGDATTSRWDQYRPTVARSSRSMGPVIPRQKVVSSGSPIRSAPPTPQAPTSTALPPTGGQLPMQPLLGAQP